MTIATAFGIVQAKLAWIQRSLHWQHSPSNSIERKFISHEETSQNIGTSIYSIFSRELGKNVILENFEGPIITFKSAGTLYPIQVNLFCEILHKLLNDDLWAKALTLCRRVQVNLNGNHALRLAFSKAKYVFYRIQCCGPPWRPFHQRRINWKSAKKRTRHRCKSTKSHICNTSRWIV